jgi:Flp pilus assembly protein TadD
MSLIHEALKKAGDKEKAPMGSGLASFQDAPKVSGGRKVPTRVIILAAVLAVGAAIFLYTQFSNDDKKKPVKASPASSATNPVSGKMNVEQLKDRALDAYRTGDMDAAWSVFSTVSRLDKSNPEIWNNMGLVAKKRGDIEAARQSYEKALKLKPEYPEAMNNLAVLDMDEGKVTDAKSYLEKALVIKPAYPEANFNMALLYEKKGDTARAIDYYKRFLEVGGDFPSNVVDAVRDHIVEIENK